MFMMYMWDTSEAKQQIENYGLACPYVLQKLLI